MSDEGIVVDGDLFHELKSVADAGELNVGKFRQLLGRDIASFRRFIADTYGSCVPDEISKEVDAIIAIEKPLTETRASDSQRQERTGSTEWERIRATAYSLAREKQFSKFDSDDIAQRAILALINEGQHSPSIISVKHLVKRIVASDKTRLRRRAIRALQRRDARSLAMSYIVKPSVEAKEEASILLNRVLLVFQNETEKTVLLTWVAGLSVMETSQLFVNTERSNLASTEAVKKLRQRVLLKLKRRLR